MVANLKEITADRLQLLANGYSPIPNRDKACYLPGWPKVTIDDAAIKKWSRMRGATATGLRVEHGLGVVDLDVNHPIIEDIAEAMLNAIPEGKQPHRLERHGKGFKFAWFCRTDDIFARLHTRSWVAPGETEDDGTHMVEIFGGGSPRQFGAFGPHSHDDNGKVKVMYRWEEESPLDVPANALDVLTKDECYAMLDAAEAEFKRQGWTPVARTKRGEGVPHRAYDLTEDMDFELLDGRTVGLKELQQMVKDGYTGNCSASWLDGPIAKNRHRCLISKSSAGHLTIWESAAGITHMPWSLKPSDHSTQVDRIAEKIRERQDARRSRLTDGDDHISGAAKLLLSYAYMPTSQKPVVPLWSSGIGGAMTVANFRLQMQPYCGVEIGPHGGEKKINPVDVWLSNIDRVVIRDTQMRPDRECPVFEEDGETYLNTYRPNDLGASDGGNPEGGLALLKQVFPIDEDRGFFEQWLAFKWKHPHIPGPAIISVANGKFGTGRGSLMRLFGCMFGYRYVSEVPFKIFTGQNYQSQYTDWQFDSLINYVEESSASGDISSYKLKHDVYEHLKGVVDPAPKKRKRVRKGDPSDDQISCASYFIATNHKDALPLPENDRRFAVLRGGDTRQEAFWAYIHTWMDKKANIAAFVNWLEAVNLESYNPFGNPPKTAAKMDMAEANRTDLDRALDEVLGKIRGFFLVEHVVRQVAQIQARDGLDLPDRWKMIAKQKVLNESEAARYGEGKRPLRIMVDRRECYPRHMVKREADNAHQNVGVVRRDIMQGGGIGNVAPKLYTLSGGKQDV